MSGNIKVGPLSIYGNKKEMEAAVAAISKIRFAGNEDADVPNVLLAIRENKLKATFLYQGRTIYHYDALLKEFKKMIDTNDISSMTDRMYTFCSDMDIAHYNKHGFIDYYDGSFTRLYEECLVHEAKRKYHSYSVRVLLQSMKEYYESANQPEEQFAEGEDTTEMYSVPVQMSVFLPINNTIKQKNRAKKPAIQMSGGYVQDNIFDLMEYFETV